MAQLSTSVQPIGTYFYAPLWEQFFGSRLEKLSKADKYKLVLMVGAKGSAQEDFPEPDPEGFAGFSYLAQAAHEEHNIWFSDEHENTLWILCDALSEGEALGLLQFLSLDLATTK